MKILMVCLGNICRSPLAEGIMRKKIEDHGLSWEVDSAGTSSWHIGQAPDNRSVHVAKKYGIDISLQRGRQIQPNDIERYDLIFAMDSSNYRDLLKLAESPELENKIKLILTEGKEGNNRNVPDPYWDDDGFENVFQLLESACGEIVKNNI
jgi:protein-tyrosine phosphatase